MTTTCDTTRDIVKQYYSALKSTSDLKTSACCTTSSVPPHVRSILQNIHQEVKDKYYGCGFVCPPLLEGLTVVDLGCGTGRDCFLLSALVGSTGKVIGIDMTDEQLAVANKYVDYHTKLFGYSAPNVEFRKGYIEDLKSAGIEDNSVDLIVSNCVVNLSPDKEAVLRECFRVLKLGGEMYFSDVYADRRIDPELRKDPVLYGECLSGALYWNDFKWLAQRVGFCCPLLVEDKPIEIRNGCMKKKLGPVKFYSATYRLLKVPDLEPDCEDYGQAVCYKGTIPTASQEFVLDKNHVFESGRITRVCGNTFRQLFNSRYFNHFIFYGDFQRHFGLFSSTGKTTVPFNTSPETTTASCSAGGCC